MPRAGRQGELSVEGSPLDDPRVRDALTRATAYPHDPSARELQPIQTHLSHVFLSGERVYKFRKPVDLGFVDFSTRAARNADCLREVALNRRLAPDVYLGVAPLELEGGEVRVGKPAEALASDASEHCVVMRRLPDGRDALSLLSRGALAPERVERVARRIARFHAEQARPAACDSRWLARATRPAWANFDALRGALRDPARAAQLDALEQAAGAFVRREARCFEARAARAVDGHGDLHLQHVWFERDEDEPIAIDCVEFDADLRHIDPASEVAFFSMDLRYRGAHALAEGFLRAYAAETDDFDLYRVVDWFESYRAAVRAKVAALAASEPEIDPQQRARSAESALRHLEQALASFTAPRRPRLVLVGGAVGTGKSTVAAALAERLDAVTISSDRVRKHRLGLAPGRAAPASAYTPDAKREVYDALLARADAVTASGRTAILDASFGARGEREQAHAWAAARRLPAHFVEVRCAPDVAKARLAERARRGRDPSDAGPELHDASLAGFEPLAEWPAARRHAVATDTGAWHEQLGPLARAIEGGER